MIFTSFELAARVERVEARFITDSVAHAVARRGVKGFSLSLGGGYACCAGPGSPLNKLVGVGFGSPPTPADWDRIEAAYDALAIPAQVELSARADPALAGALNLRGYRVVGFEDVLGRRLDAAPQAPEGARRAAPEERGRWLDAVVEGFTTPDDQGPPHEGFDRAALEAVLADMAGIEGFSLWLAEGGGAVMGGGGLRIYDGVAQLCAAATRPAYRRRGAQSRLVAARLDAAAAAGCDLAVVVTSPGSRSQANAIRHGFCLLYTRVILARDVARA